MAEETKTQTRWEDDNPPRPRPSPGPTPSPQTGGTEPWNEEIGRDEAWYNRTASGYDLWLANHKRTYDEFLHESLEEMRRRRAQFDESFTRSRDHSQELNNVALQALQNAVTSAQMVTMQAIRHSESSVDTANMVGKEALKHNANTDETANMVGKQAVRHGDIAIDREWNIDETAYLLTKNEVFSEAVAAAVAKAVQPILEELRIAKTAKA